MEKGDVVCSHADRTRTGKVQDDDGTVGQEMMRVRWDDTGDVSDTRATAALEYGQAKEDRTSEIAVRIFILSKSKGTYLYLHTYMNSCTRFTCRLYCNGPRNLKEIIIDLKRQNHSGLG